jgi:hypothetical protein
MEKWVLGCLVELTLRDLFFGLNWAWFGEV